MLNFFWVSSPLKIFRMANFCSLCPAKCDCLCKVQRVVNCHTPKHGLALEIISCCLFAYVEACCVCNLCEDCTECIRLDMHGCMLLCVSVVYHLLSRGPTSVRQITSAGWVAVWSSTLWYELWVITGSTPHWEWCSKKTLSEPSIWPSF